MHRVILQDHTNPKLREALTKWLNWLKDDIGFEGWRFDFAKGYGAEFVAEYCQGTVGTSVLNVGEFWTDAKWVSFKTSRWKLSFSVKQKAACHCLECQFPSESIICASVISALLKP